MINRRAFLSRYAGSLGGLALAQLLAEQGIGAIAGTAEESLRSKFGKAKSVICLFQHGGPSQMDLFDPKPSLQKYHGKPYPGGNLEVHFNKQMGNVLGSPYKFKKHGGSGIELSEILPHTAGIVDDITMIRSMSTESVDHESALRLIHTGRFLAGMPVWGSWVVYGLGSENKNLPSYVVLTDPGGMPVDGERNWSAGWMPAVYQGTPFRSGGTPVFDLKTPSEMTANSRRQQLDWIHSLNRRHLERHANNTELDARLRNFETASRMQMAVPDVLDFSKETATTKQMYGLDNPATAEYGRRCMLARRLVENGVRFVQLYLKGQPWDTHSKNAESLKGLCGMTDQPSAALVKDLKQRGMLDSTIVIWTGEFGRLPISQGTDGRDHNRHAFSTWIAGGGFKKGYTHGATDDFGYASVKDVVNVHDLHATLLHTLGLDHTTLAIPHDGRDTSLTDHEVTGAKIVPQLLM
jgi:hypothetical protein